MPGFGRASGMSTEKIGGGEIVIGPVTKEIMGPEPSNVRGLIEEKVKEMSEGHTHEPRGVRVNAILS